MISANYVDGLELRIKELATERNELQQQNAELVAQLRMIRKIFRDESLSTSEKMRKMPFVIDLTPEKCLREIQAEAHKEGFIAGVDAGIRAIQNIKVGE